VIAVEQPFPSAILQARYEETPSALILHLRGEVDGLTAPLFREHLLRLVGLDRPIIVDCHQLQYLDMRGVRVLEDCHREAARQGQRLVLVGSVPLVHKILTIVELSQRIPVVDSMGEALRILEQEGRS
jgi:anti-anti-sigma factor